LAPAREGAHDTRSTLDWQAEPIALLATDPLLVLAKSGISAGDLQGLIAWSKANPDKAAMGHSGFGGMSHVAGVLFQKELGTRFFRQAPYRGAAPAFLDLAAGHIDLQIVTRPRHCLECVRVW
jgi:tripartite-type tricarboxylate transporter receptor subunit TctC